MNKAPQQLPFHEWLIVALILALMLCLTAITYMRNEDILPSTKAVHALVSQDIHISIQGAIAKPGDYTLKQGSTLGQLLDLVEPLPEADLSRQKRNKKLREGQHIYVPPKTMITIHLEGAVEQPGVVQVTKGTRMNELISKVALLPEADPKPLQKKRRLKDQEVIVIPKKSI